MARTIMVLLVAACLCGCVTTPADARRRALESKLDSILVPEMNFTGCEPACAVLFLEQTAREADKEHKGISIICFCPYGAEHEMTLSAKNISLREALNICCEVGRMRWTVEDSVVKIRASRQTQAQHSPGN